jgi:hypothetical protein
MDAHAESSVPARTVAELIEQSKRNPLRWLIPDTLLEDGTHLLHGSEETFKTMLTIQLHEALTLGGHFLGRPVEGGLVTGIAELEMKPRIFGHRLLKFFGDSAPSIKVLSQEQRRKVLAGRTPIERIGTIADWAEEEGLQFLSIDSAAKLSPPGWDISRQDLASEIFNQIQRLPTSWILAHDRKLLPGIGGKVQVGNQETAGSGRYAQDPDVIHQMVRPDARAPKTVFHWGKSREGEKPEPMELYFDRVAYRLFPVHPFLHLLSEAPVLEAEIVAEAERRYGWKERNAREYIATLLKLQYEDGKPIVTEQMQGHSKALLLTYRDCPPGFSATLHQNQGAV